ncbi:MAG: hypothetical protein A2Y73_00935 [Chloroflexi bacterium RBG_13_56_8]|nr:MAG: hypothetical protein A2Y73_00935 [Chloroflexi bacterium RBG_13_56_8]
MTIDLHVHTTASDGLHTPKEVVKMANAIGLQAISICDHDTVDGLPEAFEAARDTGLEVIPGVEISADYRGQEVHILGYFVDHENLPLRDALACSRDSRRERGKAMLAKLESLGIFLSWDRVQELAGTGSLGRVHIAEALHEAGYVASPQEAFDRYIGNDRPAYAHRFRIQAIEAMRLIRGAGGLPTLAHPRDVQGAVPELVAGGLVGLEVYYTGYSREMTSHLRALARRHNLLCTGGSDFHGLALLPDHALGSVSVPTECVENLRARERLLHATS